MNDTPTGGLIADAEAYLSHVMETYAERKASGIIRRLLDRVRELETGLTWTDAKPTVDGRYYWFRYVPEDIGEIVYFRDGRINLECGLHRVEEIAGQFAGPLPTPGDPQS